MPPTMSTLKFPKRSALPPRPSGLTARPKYAAVACGDASIYLRLPRSSSYREKIWDHAAGAFIVEQAGGRVTDFSGNPLDFTCGELLEKNTGIVATNGIIHEQVLDAISKPGTYITSQRFCNSSIDSHYFPFYSSAINKNLT